MKINRLIKTLILSDFLIISGWELLGPIFAIFLLKNIEGGNVKVAGFAAAVYWISKSLIQPFIGKYLDKNHGEKDDFWFMFFGLMIAAFVPLGFIFARYPWHIYGLQLFHALGMACTVPSWSAIFTRHIDKGQEAFEWSMYSTSIGFGAGIAGAVGGFLASVFGFEIIFIGASLLTFFSAFCLLVIRNQVTPKDRHLPPVGIREIPV